MYVSWRMTYSYELGSEKSWHGEYLLFFPLFSLPSDLWCGGWCFFVLFYFKLTQQKSVHGTVALNKWSGERSLRELEQIGKGLKINIEALRLLIHLSVWKVCRLPTLFGLCSFYALVFGVNVSLLLKCGHVFNIIKDIMSIWVAIHSPSKSFYRYFLY